MYLVYATPPTVYSDSFETLHAFRSWSEDAHILGRELLRVLLPPPMGELCRLCFFKSMTSNELFATCWPSGGLGVWVLQRVKYVIPHFFLKNKYILK